MLGTPKLFGLVGVYCIVFTQLVFLSPPPPPSLQYCSEVIHSLDAQVVTRIREIDLSSFPLLLPVLQEVAENSIPTIKLVKEGTDDPYPALR